MIDNALLSDSKRQKTFPKGERIIPDGAIYIVVNGQIDIYQVTPAKKLSKRESVGVGMSIGERSFFGLNDFYVYMPLVETTVYEITKDTFDEVAVSNPRLLYGLIQNIFIPPKFIPAPTTEQTSNIEPPKAPAPQPKPFSGPSVQAVSLFPEGHKNYPEIVHPEYEKLLFDKEFKCPYCEKTFHAKKAFDSKLVADGPMRFDLRKKFVGFDTTWYDLLTCPHCYFTMFTDTFTTPGKLHPRMIQEVMDSFPEQIILDFDAPRDINFVFATHYMAIPLAEGYSNNAQILMKLWADISWLYEEVGDTQMEKYAAEQAAKASEKLYMESRNLSPTQEQLVCLSAAGMAYRAEKVDSSVIKWLFNAKTNQQGKATYAELAEDLMEDIKALQKEQAAKASES